MTAEWMHGIVGQAADDDDVLDVQLYSFDDVYDDVYCVFDFHV